MLGIGYHVYSHSGGLAVSGGNVGLVSSESCRAWAMDRWITRQLAIDALNMGIKHVCLKSGLIHHSDRGVQYASNEFQALLKTYGIRCSMSRKGDCWDNAVAESFFHTLKVELIHGKIYNCGSNDLSLQSVSRLRYSTRF